MKKFLVLFLLLTLGFVAGCSRKEDTEENMLYIHYYRFDDDYDSWSLWLWPNEPVSAEGAQYFFEDDDDYGALFKLPLEDSLFEDSTTLGIIVRGINDWTKDVESDRFIDMTQRDENNNVHVYLVENTYDIFYSPEQASLGDQVTAAQFIDEYTIEFRATGALTEDKITVFENDVAVGTMNFDSAQNVYFIELVNALNLLNSYHIEVDFGDDEPFRRMVRFDGFYESSAFNEAFGYDGELGAIYSETETTFKLWAPISESVTLNLYTVGHRANQVDYDGHSGVDTPYETIAMTRKNKGVFETTVSGDLDLVYYTFTVTNDGVSHEVVDPYAYSAGVNGQRGMVINFERYNPANWAYGERPDTMENYTDAIIYELHVRDLTSHASWNGTEDYRGKFLGLTEQGTTFKGVKTGLDHILELGVTHVQFIPIFDHGIIDETKLKDPAYHGIHDGIFNWGYMPEHFNVIEGSYSTDPYNGQVRVNELKKMIQTFHEHDVRVIMDVVYNHTGKSADSNFDRILPGYYFRMNDDGSFSNGSGTGNETASERYMFRKYMIDSLLFWVEEYNVDGFRFDLMKLHDVETMNLIADALHEIDPTIMIFGEPWTGGGSPLPDAEAAYNANLTRMPQIAVFNDDTRDGVKGSVFDASAIGFVQGHNRINHNILLGITGATAQPGLPIAALPKGAWAVNPTQTINYVTAHDNNTLHDKLMLSTDTDWATIVRMQRQSNHIILTSQGIAFLHAGVEIMRTKPCVVPTSGENTCDANQLYDHNSYRSPDEVNQIDWQWKVDNIDTFNYYQQLIELRKNKDVFRLATAAEVSEHLTLLDIASGLVGFVLNDDDDYWQSIYILHNNGGRSRDVTLLAGTTWQVIATTDDIADSTTVEFDGNTIWSMETLFTYTGGETITLAPNESLIMVSTDKVTP